MSLFRRNSSQNNITNCSTSSWSCDTCSREFTRKFILNWHKEIHVHPDQRPNIPCKTCGKNFTRGDNYRNHAKAFHGTDITAENSEQPQKLRALQPDDYTVGWICASASEYETALAILDEIHEDLEIPGVDLDSYSLGSMKGHNIVLACLPAGESFETSATHINRAFPSIKFGSMGGFGSEVSPETGLGGVGAPASVTSATSSSSFQLSSPLTSPQTSTSWLKVILSNSNLVDMLICV